MFKQKVPWHTSIVMSPEELSFLYATKGGGPKQGMEGGYDWSALASFRVRLTVQLPPGCLADTRQTSLTNEGLCLVHWGNLSSSWPDVNEINLKFYWIRI